MNILKNIMGLGLKREEEKVDRARLPAHIAIIVDGNGRWAKKRGLPRNFGHREGANNLKRIVTYCADLGIKYMTVYAFSTENWRRPKDEVDGLMKLLKEFLGNAEQELGGRDVRINVLGDITALPGELQDEILRIEDKTKNNTGFVLNIALNYGGRMEITNAIRRICQSIKNNEITEEEISEQIVSKYLYTKGIPDPDLVIRTSGEQRISNFLLWQIAYSELWFDKDLWPDFKEKNMVKAIINYQNRQRRYGGV